MIIMNYDAMKKLFTGVDLEVNDLFLLDPYQITDLEMRAPKRELSAILHARGDILTFFQKKCPSMGDFFSGIMTKFGPQATKSSWRAT